MAVEPPVADPGARTISDEDAEAVRVASTEAAMAEAGEPLYESAQQDYFAFDEVHETFLPDGKSWVEHRELNEGQRKKYLNSLNREAKIQRATGDTVVKLTPGDERHSLLKAALCGWNLKRGGIDVPFQPKYVDEFLEKANPRVIDLIEKDVRKANPWLLAEVSVEDIDKEIAELQELRAKKLEEDQGKAAS